MKRKLSNLYNLPMLGAFKDSYKKRGFKDTPGGIVLANNLIHLDPEIFSAIYPENTFLNSGVVIDNTGGFNKMIRSKAVNALGEMTTSLDRTSNKGKISLNSEKSDLLVSPLESFCEWSESEIQEAKLENIDLVGEYMKATDQVYKQTIDKIGYIGVSNIAASKGLLNYSFNATDSASGTALVSTPKVLYEDLSGLIRAQWAAVANTPEYMADRLVMPVTAFNALFRIYDVTSGKSVMQMLNEHFPTIQISSTIHAASVSGVTVTVAWSTNSQSMKMRIPVEMQVGEIVKNGSFQFTFDTLARIAGLDVFNAKSARRMTGL